MTAENDMPSQEAIVDRLVNAGYRTFEARGVAKKLFAMSEELQEAFVQWWATKEYPAGPSFGGFTVERLMGTGRFEQPESAFIFLEWLRTDPDQATVALSMPVHRVLEKEH
jgi:hypothetical protein